MKLKLALTAVFAVSLCAHAQEKISLNQVIALALEKNFDVRLVQKNVETAETNQSFSKGAFLPLVNGTASKTWNSNDQELEFANEANNRSGEARSNNLNASVQATWTLFDGTRMFAAYERFGAVEEQSRLLLKDQMVNTISSIIINYYDVVRQKQQLQAIREQMSVSEERVKLAERKLQVGTGIKPELLQARVDYNAQRTQVLQQETLIQQLKQQLNALVGMQLPQVFEVADSIVIDTNLDYSQFLSQPETNYGVQAARSNLRISSLVLRENRASYFPTLDLIGAYNYTRVDNTKLLNPFGPTFNLTQGFNYGLNLSIPILNGFNNRRLTQLARIDMQRQEIAYEQARTQVDVGLKNAALNYENAKQILAIEEENISLAKENVSIALETFKRGVSTFIELRTAQQSLEAAYNRLIAARYNTKLAETELLRLSGKLLQ